jgi:DNA-binding transcriptional ArsR family regulator
METIPAQGLKTMRKHAGAAAAVMAALSHEARLRVLCDLVGGERTAGELVERSGLSQSALSQHLSKLKAQGLVVTRRKGVSIFYRIANPDAARILGVLYDIYCKR